MPKRRKQIEQSKPPLSEDAWVLIIKWFLFGGGFIYFILKMV